MHEKEYKIFELILIILINILIYVYLTNSKQIFSLNDIKTHLENNNYLFLMELFNYIIHFLKILNIKIIQKKIQKNLKII